MGDVRSFCEGARTTILAGLKSSHTPCFLGPADQAPVIDRAQEPWGDPVRKHSMKKEDLLPARGCAKSRDGISVLLILNSSGGDGSVGS